MGTADVLAVLDALDAAGIEYRLDGGWGVDALVGSETRPHLDLDLVVDRGELRRAEETLAPVGFARDETAQPGLPARLVLRASAGRQVDLHPVVFDEAGDGWQELGGGEWGRYPLAGLDGRGEIGGRRVPCVTADVQLAHHRGYEPDDVDRHDVALLEALVGDR
jgi:lincosamide nucleotidyltransferase A/C/D/E